MLKEKGQSADSNNILDKEIESWKDFEYALRENIRKLLKRCQMNATNIRIQLKLKANPLQLNRYL
jgi:hypothetical protein